MRLFKNVTKTVLGIKSPRRIFIEPGMIIDVDAIGDIARTDISMFIDRGNLVAVEQAKQDKKAVEVQSRPVVVNAGKKPTTEAAVENQTVVIHSIVKEEDEKAYEPEVGRVSKSGSCAAVISAPQDTPQSMNPPQEAPVKGATYDALPQNVKEAVKLVEDIAAGKVTHPAANTQPVPKKGSKKAKK